MNATETIFKPKYRRGHYGALVAAPIMAGLSVFLAVVRGEEDPKLYLIAAFFLLCAAVIPWASVRRIRFGTKVLVDRYLLPPRTFEYTDIVDVGLMSIKTRRGNISLYQVQNVDELHEMLDAVIRRGQLSETQIEGKLVSQEAVAWTASIYALLMSVVGSLVLAFVRPSWLNLDGRLLLVALFLLLYGPVYMVVRRKSA